VIRCAITDASRFGPCFEAQLAGLLEDAARWAELGVDFVQLREKTLAAGELSRLAKAMMGVLREHGGTTKLLINGRADVALASGADGVHLTSSPDELTPAQVRQLFAGIGKSAPLVSASCHTLADAVRARDAGVNFILFGPVFGKTVDRVVVAEATGLDALREACEAMNGVSVLALGGVDEENAPMCLAAGAAGVAGIRLFF
jgi:thiamine-phosphate pyrophosphorylase